MTAQVFNYKTKELLNRKDKSGAIDLFNQYQVSQCYSPIRLRVYDAHLGAYVKRLLPCGKCYHCMETKINEWVTRMYAHLEDYKYAYFVTLTYRSITNPELPVNQLLLNKLSQAVWHFDALNSTKHSSYNPCVLCKEHYQNFIKRLRKNTHASKLTYVLCGEYGEKYGRPHFHIILFVNQPISYEQVQTAWSLALWRSDSGEWSYRNNQKYNGTAYNFPIGRIDYNDLVSNGTINTANLIKVDGNYMNAANCFSYVCKYVCKRDSFNRNRVLLAYKNLFYTETMCNSPLFGNCPLGLAAEFCRVNGLDILFNTLKSQSYEEKMPLVSLEIAGKINFVRTENLYGQAVTKEYFPCDIKVFCDRFVPFVEFSRGVPIGSLYARTHIQEFTQGVFNKPILQTRGFVVPSYFRTKAKEYTFGLRRMRKSIRSTTYPKGNLLDLYRHLESVQCNESSLAFVTPYWKSAKDYNELLKDQDRTLRDAYTGQRYLFIGDRVIAFRYNRSTRTYDQTEHSPLATWLSTQLDKLSADFRQYRLSEKLSVDNTLARESGYFNIARLGLTYRNLNRRFIEQQNLYLHRQQKEYNSVHLSVE